MIDRDGPNGGIRPGDLEPGPDMAVLALGVERGPIPDGAGAIGVTGEATLSVRCSRSGDIVRGATPIGYGAELAAGLGAESEVVPDFVATDLLEAVRKFVLAGEAAPGEASE